MLDIKLLRTDTEAIKVALKKKHIDPTLIDNVLSLDREKRALTQQLDEFLAQRNTISKEMPKLAPEEKKKRLAEMQFIKEQIAELEPKVKKLEEEVSQIMLTIPNPPLASVPEGKDDTDNKPTKYSGTKRAFDFKPRDHMEIAGMNDLVDMEAAGNASGSRFYYLKGTAALLEFALIQFVMQKLVHKGFTPIIPPVLVKEKSMYGTGFFPTDRNEIYHVNAESDDLYLVGTAEVPLCMMHADKVIPAEKLPLRFVGFSTCFRREAGSYGKDTAGIMRVHQFDKIEMFSFCHPDKSEEEHELIRSIEEEIMTELGFHYQLLNICGGDLGAPAAKKYDIEVWIPSQERYRELTSCSNCTDFQARRANIKFKEMKEGKAHTQFLHTLNGTACAMSRTLIAIMENYQREDGTFEIPDVLKPYLPKM